jgi:hypothetical protein
MVSLPKYKMCDKIKKTNENEGKHKTEDNGEGETKSKIKLIIRLANYKFSRKLRNFLKLVFKYTFMISTVSFLYNAYLFYSKTENPQNKIFFLEFQYRIAIGFYRFFTSIYLVL